jgi:hypothetical protein
MSEPIWDDERNDVMYPSVPEDVLPRYSDEELRSLLDQRLQYAREHPEDLMTTQESFDYLMSLIK